MRFISGECDHATRKAALKELADKKIDVLIGTTILDVGVDVPATGMIILAGAGKAEVALRQRVGRGLRAKKTGPNVAFIVDFEDIYNDHLKVHFQQRHSQGHCFRNVRRSPHRTDVCRRSHAAQADTDEPFIQRP